MNLDFASLIVSAECLKIVLIGAVVSSADLYLFYMKKYLLAFSESWDSREPIRSLSCLLAALSTIESIFSGKEEGITWRGYSSSSSDSSSISSSFFCFS
jgi:hypothetical protein